MTAIEPLVIGMAQALQEDERPNLEEIKVPDTSVVVLYPSNGNVHVMFHRSLGQAQQFDRHQGWDNLVEERCIISNVNVSKARNELARWYLEETDAEWAWFIDTDMVIQHDTLPRLLCTAQASGAKVLGALCCTVDDIDGPIPTIFQFGAFNNGELTRVTFDYPDDNTVLQVAATGAACLLVHRSVFEEIQRRAPDVRFPWFNEAEINNNWVSEDLMFCLRANSVGMPVFVDCTAHVGHAKGHFVWWPSDIKKGRGFPTPKNYAIIPVKNKLKLTSHLIKQLQSQGECDGIIVLDNGSTKKTKDWLAKQPDVLTVDGRGMGIHEMWNLGVEHAMKLANQRRNVNVMILNNDLHIGDRFVSGLAGALRSSSDVMAVSANYDEREIKGMIEPTTDICAERYDGTGGFAGFAFAVRAEWFMSGYKFPEQCKWWYGDNDLVMAIAHAQGVVGIARDAAVVHVNGGAQTSNWKNNPEFMKQADVDRQAFEERWRQIEASTRQLTLEDVYNQLVETPSDINEHLPTLVDLCKRTDAKTIIELGVRMATSTIAWLKGAEDVDAQVWSVDVDTPPPLQHERWSFIPGNDLDPFVVQSLPDDADIVFIDTNHEYQQTLDELNTYADKLRPGGCFVLHDWAVEKHEHHTTEQPPFPVKTAVEEFVEKSGGKLETWENNNGLAVIWR